MSDQHVTRFEGIRWSLLYGNATGMSRTALIECERSLQRFLPYVLQTRAARLDDLSGSENLAIIGTPTDNDLIRKLVDEKYLVLPESKQGFQIRVSNRTGQPDAKLLVISGNSPAGVLNGVMAFASRIASTELLPDRTSGFRKALDSIRDVNIVDSPLIENRGFWTWGYVIYDYRRYLDAMMRLRLNQLTVWNDVPPLNFKEVVSYADDRGITVVPGFHWGWGKAGLDISKPDDRKAITRSTVETFQRDYAGRGYRAIYFQTLTEHTDRDIGGVSVASAVTKLVNETAKAIWNIEPDIEIQFGLHALSIGDRYGDLSALDERIVIVWEDAGNMPYAYEPTNLPDASWLKEFPDVDSTLLYSKTLATFRPGTEFALVPKGWTKLSWDGEFEHHGEFILGERHPEFIRRRRELIQPRWDRIDKLWLEHYPLAQRFYSELLDLHPPKMTVTGLVEDGVIETGIPVSVSLFAETVWNPKRSKEAILRDALSPFYKD